MGIQKMNLSYKSLLAFTALAGLMAACGGNSSSLDGLSQYAGRVTDGSGVPVAGLSIQLKNRVTEKITEVSSAEDGRFSAEVVSGAYDIVIDDKDETNYVALKKTAIDLRDDKNEDVRIEKTNGIALNLLTGLVKDASGAALVNRKILVIPLTMEYEDSISGVKIPDPFFVKTDENGEFSHPIGLAEVDFGFDMLVLSSNAPDLDLKKLAIDYKFSSEEEETKVFQEFEDYISAYGQESIDVEKPDGPMHVDLVFGSDTRNPRSVTGAPSLVAGDVQKFAGYKNNLTLATTLDFVKSSLDKVFSKIISSAYADELSEKFIFDSLEDYGDGRSKKGVLKNGKIRFEYYPGSYSSKKEFNLRDIVVDPKNMDINFLENMKMKIFFDKDGSRKDVTIEFNTVKSGEYWFLVSSTKKYIRLMPSRNNKYYGRLSWNASDPVVRKFEFELD